MCSCWVCCENRQARQYWHIYNYFFAMTNHMFIIFSRVAVLLRFAQLMIFWQLKLFVQIKVTTVQLVRFKILYLDICYETVIEFCLLQEWYCRRLRLYLWTKVNVTSDMALLHIMTKPLQKFENNKPHMHDVQKMAKNRILDISDIVGLVVFTLVIHIKC